MGREPDGTRHHRPRYIYGGFTTLSCTAIHLVVPIRRTTSQILGCRYRLPGRHVSRLPHGAMVGITGQIRRAIIPPTTVCRDLAEYIKDGVPSSLLGVGISRKKECPRPAVWYLVMRVWPEKFWWQEHIVRGENGGLRSLAPTRAWNTMETEHVSMRWHTLLSLA